MRTDPTIPELRYNIMKHILCFGDSNTFGSNPLGGRHPYEKRFTGLMQAALGPGYRIIEEGMGGRTTVFEDELDPGRCGKKALPCCIATHNPLDLIILMLGTNDLKHRYQVTPWDLGRAMEHLLRIIETAPYAPSYPQPQVLLVSPIHVGEHIEHSPFGCFTHEAVAISHRFAEIYAEVARLHGVHFLDAAAYAQPSAEDQLHMNEQSHAALAAALTAKVREILG